MGRRRRPRHASLLNLSPVDAAAPTSDARPGVPPRVVIAGAGFGGLWAARRLAAEDVDVLVLDRANHHTFFPLLYQVAAAELEPTSIAHPVRSILRGQANADFLMASVTGLDPEGKRVLTDRGDVPYDALVLALGSATHFYGVDGADRHAFPLRWMDDAVRLQHQVLSRFEEAAHESEMERKTRLLTFVVVGGGPTGVEFSGALAELVFGPLLKDFPGVRAEDVRIVLLEAGDRLLQGMPPRLGRYAADRLERRHVEVILHGQAERVGAQSLTLTDGVVIPTETVVWTAGVKGPDDLESWGLPLGPGGRVRVDPTLRVPGRSHVYVVGDLAYLEEDGADVPLVAPVAIQQGELAAENAVRELRGEALKAFAFEDPGMLAVIGRNAAVAHVWGRAFTGFPAWILWLVIHIAKLIGFRNRALVLVNWAWNYVAFARAARLILPRGPGGSAGAEP